MAALPRKVVKNPRMSVNDLALFMVSSDTARAGIVRRARKPHKPTISRYRYARTAARSFLTDRIRSLQHLTDAEMMLKQRMGDPSLHDKQREDARLSIEVLHSLQGMQNLLARYDFRIAPMRQKKLHISGVQVSVSADLLVYGRTRGVDQIGAAIFRMTKDDATSDSAKEKRKEMGLYVATLAWMNANQNNFDLARTVKNSLCMSIDIQHGQHFLAPTSYKRRIQDLQNACKTIALLWNQV